MGCPVLGLRPRPGRGERRKNFACGGRKFTETLSPFFYTKIGAWRIAHHSSPLPPLPGAGYCSPSRSSQSIWPRSPAGESSDGRRAALAAALGPADAADAVQQPGECNFGFRDAFCGPLHARNLSLLELGRGRGWGWVGWCSAQPPPEGVGVGGGACCAVCATISLTRSREHNPAVQCLQCQCHHDSQKKMRQLLMSQMSASV